MRAIFDNEEESLFSKESSGINTNISLAKRMKTKSTKVTSDSVDPQAYKLSVSEKLASKLGRKCTLLTEHRDMAKKEKNDYVSWCNWSRKKHFN